MRIEVNGVAGSVHTAGDGSWHVELTDGRMVLLGPAIVESYKTATHEDRNPNVATYVDGPRGRTAGRPVQRDETARVTHHVRAQGKVFVTVTGARKVVVTGPRFNWEEMLPASPLPPNADLATVLASSKAGHGVWVANLALAVSKAEARCARARAELERATQYVADADAALNAARARLEAAK